MSDNYRMQGVIIKCPKHRKDIGGGGVKRSSNFELFRIILMLFIIAHHYVVNSGLTSLYDFNHITGNMIFLQLFGMFGKTAINCFSLITGYFMVTSKITARKFLKTYLEVKFYYLTFYLIFLISGYESFSIKGLVKVVFNVVYEVGTGYTGTYMLFFLFIPFLNILVRNITKCQYALLLLLSCFYFTVISTFFLHDTFNFTGWMMVCYLIGGYIKIYPNKIFESRIIAVIGLVLSLIFMSASVVVVDYIGVKLGFSGYYFMVTDSHKFLALSCSVSAFLFFKNLKLKYNKIINHIAASTFGILLIHANSDTMRRFLWQDLLKNTVFYNSDFLILHAILSVCSVYVVGLMIDQLRFVCVEKPLFRWLDNSLWIDKLERKNYEMLHRKKHRENTSSY